MNESAYSAADFLWTAFLSLVPVVELRGGIPFALSRGISWYIAWPFCAAANALAAPACHLFLSTVHAFFLRFSWYEKLFRRIIERARKRLQAGVEKWGWLGVTVFVAIPFPLTGAWTGTLGAWVLGLSRRRTLAAVMLGVAAAGGIVTAAAVLGIRAAGIFLKEF